MSKKKKKPVFKPYDPHQLSMLPASLEELIPDNHIVRVVQQVIDRLNIDPILRRYKGGGSSSYHPKLMLKLIIYAYISNIYSSRKIEAAVLANIHFMWLAGMQKPDHNTINRFRNSKLKGVLKEVFGQVVLLIVEAGLVDLKTVYTDGTKLEANANRYTFVWGKAIKRSRERIKKQLEELWTYAETIAAEELQDNNPTTYEELDSEKVSKTIASINKALQNKPIDKKKRQKLNYAKKHWPQNLDKYKEQEKILGDRNSYSKTDHDATFMRMKEDHMRNGQLKAGYNWQISTSNQFIVNYDIYPNPTDTLTFISHMDEFENLYGALPQTVVADAGYGSEENYDYLEKATIECYVKYNYFHKEQKSKGKIEPKQAFAPQYLYYNEQQDCYICPMGQKMEKQYDRTQKKKSGYEQKLSVYAAIRCDGCPLRGACHKSKYNRQIQINHNLNRLKAKARDNLLSDQGVKYRKQRPADVEAVFGNIKQNKKFTRFRTRGNENVLIEAGLISLAHNLAKMAS